jgi:hypothetical protein
MTQSENVRLGQILEAWVRAIFGTQLNSACPIECAIGLSSKLSGVWASDRQQGVEVNVGDVPWKLRFLGIAGWIRNGCSTSRNDTSLQR